MLETDQIGAEILKDLRTQRETIESSRDKVAGMGETLSYAGKLVKSIGAGPLGALFTPTPKPPPPR